MVFALGNRVAAPTHYSPEILEPIQRVDTQPNAMHGYDCWHLYELSWLNTSGVPQHFIGVLFVDVNTPSTIESKSLKLYLNSLNFHHFYTQEEAKSVICSDIEKSIGAPVTLQLISPMEIITITREPHGILLEQAPTEPLAMPGVWVNSDAPWVTETFVSHRLRSLCPVTAQPDWGTLVVSYTGPKINGDALLDLVDSFRQKQDFHERCVEQCFASIHSHAHPDDLSITAYYQRRGGIDITPVRTSKPTAKEPWRMGRQ